MGAEDVFAVVPGGRFTNSEFLIREAPVYPGLNDKQIFCLLVLVGCILVLLANNIKQENFAQDEWIFAKKENPNVKLTPLTKRMMEMSEAQGPELLQTDRTIGGFRRN